jgi:hypothetical protein
VTKWLALLVLLSVAGTFVSYLRFDHARAAAADGAAYYGQGLADLQRIVAAGRVTGVAAVATPAADGEAQLNQRLRAAALDAGLSDQLLGIEPGQPQQLRDHDLKDTPIFLQLNGVTLPQLVAFLRRLTEDDPHIVPRNISLTAPPGSAPTTRNAAELWTADVTLAYLTYSPRTKAAAAAAAAAP